MSHTITYNSDLRFLEVTIQGKYALAEGKQLLTEVAEAIKKHECFLILADVRDIELGFSFFELFETPKILEETMSAANISAHRIKRAVLIKKGLLTSVFDSYFMETVSVNRGFMMKLFHDIDKARAWLLN